MNELVEKESIENLIYEIRGKQVMLDSDLAKLYQCKNGTKTINLAVKRHINRFPERFMFKLTENECKSISRFQSETLKGRGYNIKYLPYAFTEQGVAMLATVLRTDVAETISIRIMDAFVALRHYVSKSEVRLANVEAKILECDKEIKTLEKVFETFKEKTNHIFFEGQIYDAYSLMIDIINQSKKEIIIIDNYVDKNILDILSKTKKEVTIITNKYNNEDYNKYKKQYKNVKLVINNSFHDRFIIIDKNTLYHLGASFKDLGKKCFAITKIEDTEIKNRILHKTILPIKKCQII